jgi:DNA-binding CsgD family transcriptional regulator/DNA-directed RNA polymerase subunit RPC12/RpoP
MNTPIDDRYIAEQYALGRTTTDIAEELGVCDMTVSRHLRSCGVELRKRGPQPKPKKVEEPKQRKKRQSRKRPPGRSANQKTCPCMVLCLFLSGMSSYEIGAALGVNHTAANRTLIKLGYRRGKGNGPNRERLDALKREESQKIFSERFYERYGGRFEYLGGYLSCHDNSKPLIRCMTCGSEFERYVDWKYEIRCPECFKREVEARRETKAREEREAREARESLVYLNTCEECGKQFETKYATAKRCSHECQRKHANRRNYERAKRNGFRGLGNHRKRARKYGVQYDPSVTLPRLIKRDGLTCYLCGGRCDPDDRTYGYFGPKSPTMDHVIAMANGGGHTWDNVKVAHFICNSEKRDLWLWQL